MTYSISDGRVRWNDILLRGADATSFEALSPNFARDRNAVWVCSKAFREGTPPSLRVLIDGAERIYSFATDGRHVYRTNGPRIESKLDAATFRMLDEAFGADAKVVVSFQEGRLVRGARAESFVALGGGYGTDGARVFSGPERLPCRHASRFRVLGHAWAVDDQHAYWTSSVIENIDPARVRFVGEGYVVHDEREVYHWASIVEGADAATFRVLDRWFAKDASRVYYRGNPVESADATTFEVEPSELPTAKDAAARYVWSKNGVVRVPNQAGEVAVPSDSLDGALSAWWAALEQSLFPIFDTTFNTRIPHRLDDPWPTPAREPSSTRVQLDRKRALLVVERDGLCAEGSPSGFMHALASTWAAARSRVLDGVPCIRLLDERTGYMSPEGALVRERLLEACFAETLTLVDALGELESCAEEVELLVDLLERRARFDVARMPEIVVRRTRLGLVSPPRVHADATTNLAAIRELARHPFTHSKRAAERLAAAEFLHARLGALDARKCKHVPALLHHWDHLLDDANLRVREVAWENLDLTVQRLFERSAEAGGPDYEACVPLLQRLVARGTNLDLNLARLWECEMGLGRTAQAEDAWQRLVRLAGPEAPAPQYLGARQTKTFAEWRAAAKKRLAARR